MLKKIIHFYNWAIATITFLVFIFLIIEMITRFPVNHVGYNPQWLWLLVIAGLPTILLFIRVKEKRYMFLSGITIVFGLFLLTIDYFNMLLYYENWIYKGMPAFGE